MYSIQDLRIYAGDWSVDIGHESAFKAGIKAACLVGVKDAIDDSNTGKLYDFFLKTCSHDQKPQNHDQNRNLKSLTTIRKD